MSAQQITPRARRHSRRGRRLNYLVAGVSWALGLVALLFEVWGWLRGYMDTINILNTVFVVIGTAAGGLLALTGDGDVVLFTGADEGQRDAIYKASAPAFSVGFLGMSALWVAYQLQPAWRSDAYIHTGVLLIVTSAVYLAGYIWRRRI